MDKNKMIAETVEVWESCPYCESEEIPFPGWDVKKQGYIAKCPNCGEEIMLCNACLHADDNPGQKCDLGYHEQGKCFREITQPAN